MFTTEHRPAPLPPMAGASGDARPNPRGRKGITPSRDENGDLIQPPQSVGFSWHYAGPDGTSVKANHLVPVDDAGSITHVEYHCPDCPDSGRWVSAKLKGAPVCPVHRTALKLVDSGSARLVLPTVPWDAVWAHNRERVLGFLAPTAVVGALGAVADQADLPWWGELAQVSAVPAAVVGSWWLTRVYLTRTAVARGTLDPDDEVAGRRRRKLIARRARAAGYCAALAGLWVQVADAVDIDLAEPSGWALLAGLVAAGLAGSRPYLKYADERRARNRADALVPDEDPEDTTPQPTDHELLAAYVVERWQRVSAPGRVLAGTRLERIAPCFGGWMATIVADDESDLDPEAFDKEGSLRKIARAYGVGVSMVSITADPEDANRALILVQRTSPLAGGRRWDGTGINPTTGTAETGTLDDGSRIRHEFWRPGWGAVMELIAGCTGSGKSEYLNLLLALERLSRMVVSWVADPQMGQSLGDVRDGVDWFAPTTEELLLMLQTAVAVMLARNLAITRMRVKERRPDGTVVERRVKYVEVSPENPLLSITVDEAHLPMNDPDLGKTIVKMLALLAKSGRKCNIKLRLLVQSPLLSELKDSVLRAQLSSGLVTVFRTADKLTGAAAWPGRMPADPSNLPAVWPDGSTAAGVGYMSGQRPMKMRTDFAGDLYDLMHDGPALGLEPAVLGTAGVAYADRWKRLAAFDSMDPAELLGMGVPTIDLSNAQPAGDSKGGGREAVLRVLSERWLDGDEGLMPFKELATAVRDVIRTRACTNVCNRLVDERLVENVGGKYRLTQAGAEQLGLLEEADA